MLERFIEWARSNNWNIAESSGKNDLPDEIKNRYELPEKWYGFICRLSVCENETAETWFLTRNDYLPNEQGFQWNEFELQSLEYGDDKDSVVSFWNTHLPIVISVGDEYSYYAIDTENGNVVSGCEPEYEEVTVTAEDFEEFIDRIISGEILL